MADLGQYQEPVRSIGRGSRQKIIKLKEELQTSKQRKSSQEEQAGRIRQLKESYDLALIKADEMVRGPNNNNIYIRAHGERAKRIYTAISSVIYSTIAIANVKGLEEYIRQNALTLPASMIDLAEWEYVLRTANDCRAVAAASSAASTAAVLTNDPYEGQNSPSIVSNNSQLVARDVRKKFQVLQYLATQPVQTTKDEIQLLKQSVFETLNEFAEGMTQTMNMIVYVVDQMRESYRQDTSHGKDHAQVEEQVLGAIQQEKKREYQALESQRVGYEKQLETARGAYEAELQKLKDQHQQAIAKYTSTEATLTRNVDDLQRALRLAKEEIGAKDARATALDKEVQRLQTELQKEIIFSQEISAKETSNIAHIMASSTADQVLTDAVALRSHFDGSKDVEQIISKEDEGLAAGFAETKTRLQATIASLETRLAEERRLRGEENAAAARQLNELQNQLSEQETDFDSLSTSFAQLRLAYNELEQQHEQLAIEKQNILMESLQRENEVFSNVREDMRLLMAGHQELRQLLSRAEEEKAQLAEMSQAAEHEKIRGLEQTIATLTKEIELMRMNATDGVNNQIHNLAVQESEKISSLHETIASLNTQLAAVTARLEAGDAEKRVLLENNAATQKENEKIGALNRHIEELQQEITLLKSSQAASAAAIAVADSSSKEQVAVEKSLSLLPLLAAAESQILDLLAVIHNETNNHSVLMEMLGAMEQELRETQTALQQSEEVVMMVLTRGLPEEQEVLLKYEQLRRDYNKLREQKTADSVTSTSGEGKEQGMQREDIEEIVREVAALQQSITTLREENQQLLRDNQQLQQQLQQQQQQQQPVAAVVAKRGSDDQEALIKSLRDSQSRLAILGKEQEREALELRRTIADQSERIKSLEASNKARRKSVGFSEKPAEVIQVPPVAMEKVQQGMDSAEGILDGLKSPPAPMILSPTSNSGGRGIGSAVLEEDEEEKDVPKTNLVQIMDNLPPMLNAEAAIEDGSVDLAQSSLSTADSEASLVKIQAAMRRKLAKIKVQRVKQEKLGLMSACNGTIQGETGWYLFQGQYFYFCKDEARELVLLCGPLSPALYSLAIEEIKGQRELIERNSSMKPLGREENVLLIDRLAIHATRLQTETFLQDIQDRDACILSLEEEIRMLTSQQRQRDYISFQEQQKSIEKKLADIAPEQAQLTLVRLTSAARGFNARNRVKKIRLFKTASETGVLVAMGNTKQGETGWYAGPHGNIFYFVLQEGRWIYAAGPLTEAEYQASRNRAKAITKRLLAIGANQRVLNRCDFKLGGIQGDLAESGEVYMEPENGRLYLALAVEELMIELQNRPSFGGTNNSMNDVMTGLPNRLAIGSVSSGSHLDDSTDSLEGGLDQNSNIIMEGSQEGL